MADVYIVPGLRTPFTKAGAQYAGVSALELSAPIAKAMTDRARPDVLIWGQVIPDPTVSNVARELVFEADLDPEIPAFSDVMACSTSFIGALAAAGLVGRGDLHLALVGGVETMSHRPIALRQDKADEIAALAMRNLPGAVARLQAVTPQDFNIPANAWANRVSGRSMGEHTEDTAKLYSIARADQDALALASHQKAVRGRDQDGVFSDLIQPAFGVEHDVLPRPDSTLEKLASLPTVFDRGPTGSLTAGNSSPLTDGAASVWVADDIGLKRLGSPPAVQIG